MEDKKPVSLLGDGPLFFWRGDQFFFQEKQFFLVSSVQTIFSGSIFLQTMFFMSANSLCGLFWFCKQFFQDFWSPPPPPPKHNGPSLKRPLHDKLKLANSCWQTQVGVCERHNDSWQTSWQTVGENRDKLYFVLNSWPTCLPLLRRSHTPTWVCQHELANSLSCEGRFTVTLDCGKKGFKL